jgi:hypothetical protein
LDRLILSGSEPRIDGLAVPCVLELVQESAKSTNKPAVWGGSTGATPRRRAASGEQLAYKKRAEAKQQGFGKVHLELQSPSQ